MSTRVGYGLGFLACGALLAFALYLQHVQNQEPCPLCILQRVAFIDMAIVFAVAAIHGPYRRGAAIYSGLLFVMAAMGAGIAGRQVWLQHLPPDKVPACGPGLEYMLEQFPLKDALAKIFAGSGECAEVGWRFLGLSIAEWSLAWFVLLGLLAVYVALRAPRASAR
ncbi:MAG TPA: disulfide bond formation protein B [Burkholderiales bacterium]|nr:disulfide bond formation protein B [Burkholderiales bacterium]